jgi:alanyl-tRNA synthetase
MTDLHTEGALDPDGVIYNPYGALEFDGTILAMVQDGKSIERAAPGEEIEIILPETNFYVEAGGQVADSGCLWGEGWEISVTGTRKPAAGIITHIGEVLSGSPKRGDSLKARIDGQRRLDIMRNHTATHLLHAALHNVLGDHARQAGSLVAPDRLRFDFTHPEAITVEELAAIEADVNQRILENHTLVIQFKPLQQALDDGATALFGEKYGETVRNITIGKGKPFSNELCGGTHVDDTGAIGTFLITSEGSVAAGIRRIEAVTGREAYNLIQKRFQAIQGTAELLSTTPEQVFERVQSILLELNEARKEILGVRRKLINVDFTRILDQPGLVGDVHVITAVLQDADVDTLRQMADRFRQRYPQDGVAVLASVINGRPILIAAVSEGLVERGLKAGDLVKFVAKPLGGGGGGKPTLAQAGGKDPAKLDQALASVASWVEHQLGE